MESIWLNDQEGRPRTIVAAQDASVTQIPQSRRASPLVALVGRVVYFLLGWKCVGQTPAFRKYVVIAAPHTSNWDGILLIGAASMLKLEFSFFGKDSLFKGPLGWFLKRRGGIPLDRSKNQSFVTQAVSWFARHETFAIGVAPEGTRQATAGWRTGFYYIALQAQVPIVLGYIDYAKKEGGILPEVLIPTGDIDADFEILRRLYGPLVARYPERKGPIVPLKRGSSTIDESEE